MNSILDEILAEKKAEVASKKTKGSAALKATSFSPRGFVEKFLANSAPRVIAEIKKASPSKGIICEDFKPVDIAQRYEKDGAAAFSILTDEKYFKGHSDYLTQIREALPEVVILRKDFIIDPFQVEESKAFGADALLLIVSALEQSLLAELYAESVAAGLDVLIEVHDCKEMERALSLDLSPKRVLIGVNNRDLNSFDVSLETTKGIAEVFKKDLEELGVSLISESGINSKEDIVSLQAAGASGFLIGESIMKDEALLKKLLD